MQPLVRCFIYGGTVRHFLHSGSLFSLYITNSQAQRFLHLPRRASYLYSRDRSHLLKKGLLKHFLTATRTIIPRHWKSSTPPSREEWASEMSLIKRMENLIADDSGRIAGFIQTWAVWCTFQEGPNFASWLATGILE